MSRSTATVPLYSACLGPHFEALQYTKYTEASKRRAMKFDTSWSTCPCEERLRKLGLFILGRDSFSAGAYKEVVGEDGASAAWQKDGRQWDNGKS